MTRAFPYLLLPHLWASRNRARRRERGDLSRGLLFGGVAMAVGAALYQGAFWLTGQLDAYAELGDYLLRIGLSWLFLTFISFLAFSGVVASLSTFFLSDDLRLLLLLDLQEMLQMLLLTLDQQIQKIHSGDNPNDVQDDNRQSNWRFGQPANHRFTGDSR